METPAEPSVAEFDIIESIRKHVAQLNPIATKRGLICLGEYSRKILLKEGFLKKTGDASAVFVYKAKETSKASESVSTPIDNLIVDADVDTHFWFNVNAYIDKTPEFANLLKNATSELHEALTLVSIWEGLGSALLPKLNSQLLAANSKSVAIAVMPSKAQPADAHFNALASLGACASNEPSAVILLGRDAVENYIGVDRDGTQITGNSILNYLLEIALESDTFTPEITELSKAFNIRFYNSLAITGASFRVYGSFKSMLEAAQLNPFMAFDLSTTQVLYVLVRAPSQLKDALSRGKIELATAEWTKSMTNIKSVYVSEPIFLDEANDRVDAFVFAGGFNTDELTGFLHKKAARIQREIVKKGLLKEREWESLTKGLISPQ